MRNQTKLSGKRTLVIGVTLGVGISLVIKRFGEVVGMETVFGVWLLSGKVMFLILPLQFFPQRSGGANVSTGSLRSEENSRKTLHWIVRLAVTILLVPLILGGLSIRRAEGKNKA